MLSCTAHNLHESTSLASEDDCTHARPCMLLQPRSVGERSVSDLIETPRRLEFKDVKTGTLDKDPLWCYVSNAANYVTRGFKSGSEELETMRWIW